MLTYDHVYLVLVEERQQRFPGRPTMGRIPFPHIRRNANGPLRLYLFQIEDLAPVQYTEMGGLARFINQALQKGATAFREFEMAACLAANLKKLDPQSVFPVTRPLNEA